MEKYCLAKSFIRNESKTYPEGEGFLREGAHLSIITKNEQVSS